MILIYFEDFLFCRIQKIHNLIQVYFSPIFLFLEFLQSNFQLYFKNTKC